ncbi:NADPH-dependent FMN reductase [Microvirga alba]|uniref:NAD(P)H-dependent oxidoreductase n=1 Tax=Microvirga alba TaxID=2791025 RepID=A0A931BM86_9HYPH|nr:NAD(P)H-dependent oxidoreductase [Microvirga alba]MBF9233836.1 NAD(P)H-dependent oxidoreductase [Microvirga alba]
MASVQAKGSPVARPRLHVLVCSTRPGRKGPAIAKWFHGVSTKHGKFQSVLVDLAEFGLPVYDEPEHPRLRSYHHTHTRAWSESVDAADALVFVTPEYNHGPPPSLLNALNYLYHEWGNKPASFVSYGGVSAGLRAVQSCKPILNALKMVPIVENVTIPMFQQHLDEEGKFMPTDLHAGSAKRVLDELYRWTEAMVSLRVAT